MRLLRRTAALALAGLVAMTATSCTSHPSNATGVRVIGGELPGPWLGVPLDPPTAKPAITLTDTSGAPYDLLSQTAGKITLLYFGYTHCPDVCPLLMSNIAAALKQLPGKDADQIAVVFVTVDPARDTAPVLRAWLDTIDPNFVGLTGSIEQIIAAEKAAGVPTASIDAADPNGYTVLHSAEVLAFSRDDNAHVMFDASAQTTDFEHDLRLLVKGTT